MKIRTGFVSNSSSTSFTCDICGATETGWDSCGCEEFGFYQCENDHTICIEEAVGEIEMIEDDYRGRCLSSKNCPICQFHVLSQSNAAAYLEKKTGTSRDVVFAEIKKMNGRRKVLRDGEYVAYVMKEANTTEVQILEEIKSTFKDYDAFRKHLYERK